MQRVIGFGSIFIRKGKLNYRSLKSFKVRDKPNLNKIFKSYLGYHDLEMLCTSKIILKFMKKIIYYDKTNWPSNIFRNFYICKKVVGSFHKSVTHLAC
jgi:hypothetical protein